MSDGVVDIALNFSKETESVNKLALAFEKLAVAAKDTNKASLNELRFAIKSLWTDSTETLKRVVSDTSSSMTKINEVVKTHQVNKLFDVGAIEANLKQVTSAVSATMAANTAAIAEQVTQQMALNAKRFEEAKRIALEQVAEEKSKGAKLISEAVKLRAEKKAIGDQELNEIKAHYEKVKAMDVNDANQRFQAMSLEAQKLRVLRVEALLAANVSPSAVVQRYGSDATIAALQSESFTRSAVIKEGTAAEVAARLERIRAVGAASQTMLEQRKLNNASLLAVIRDQEATDKMQIAEMRANTAAEAAAILERNTAIKASVAAATNSATGAYQKYNPNTGLAGGLVNMPVNPIHPKALPDTNALIDATKSLTGHHKALNDATRGVVQGMGMYSATLTSIIPLLAGMAVGGAFKQMFDQGRDLEYQMTFVAKLTEGAKIATEDFAKAMQGSQLSTKEGAQGLRALAQAGLSAEDALTALPSVMNLAVVGEMQLGAAALVATGVMHAFNLQMTDMPHIVDVMTKAAAVSNTSVEGMATAIKTASVVSDQFGVSLEEISAGLVVMAKRNIEGTSAGTAMKNFITNLASTTPIASARMKQLGIDVYDTEDNLKKMSQIIPELADAFVGLNEKSRNEALKDLFNERGRRAAAAMIKDVELYGNELDRLTNKSAGFAASVVRDLDHTVTGQIKATANALSLNFEKAFERTADSWSNLMARFNEAAGSSALQTFVVGLSSNLILLADNIGKVSLAIAGGVIAWKTYTEAMVVADAVLAATTAANVAAGVATATTATATLTLSGVLSALGTVLSRIFWPVAAVTALYVAFKSLVGDVDAATEAFERQTRQNEDTRAKLGGLIAKLNEETAALKLQIGTNMSLADAIRRVRMEKGLSAEGLDKGQGAVLKAQEERNTALKEYQRAFKEDWSAYSESNALIEKEANLVAAVAKLRANAVNSIADDATARAADLQQAQKQVQADLVKNSELLEQASLQGTKYIGKLMKVNPNDPLIAVIGERVNKLNAYKATLVDVSKAADNAVTINDVGLLDGAWTSTMEDLSDLTKAVAKTVDDTLIYKEKVSAFGDKAGSGASKAKTEYEKLGEEISKSVALSEAEIANSGKLSAADKFRAATLNKVIEAYQRGDLTVAQYVKRVNDVTDAEALMRQADAVKELEAATKKEAVEAAKRWQEGYFKQIEEEEKAYRKLADAIGTVDKAINALLRENDALQSSNDLELSLLGQSAETRAKVIAQQQAEQQILNKYLQAEITLRDELEKGGAAPELIATKLNLLNTEKVRALDLAAQKQSITDWNTTFDSISNGLTDAIMNAGKDGGKGLRDYLEAELLTKPFKMVIQAMVQPYAQSLTNFVMGSGGGGSAGLGDLGYFMGDSAGNSMGKLDIAGFSMKEISAGMSYASALFSASEGKWGQAAGQAFGQYVGGPLGAMIGSAIGSAVDKLASGETRIGGEYRSNITDGAKYAYGPSGGDAAASQVKLAINTTTEAINATLKQVGSAVTLTAFAAGYETSDRDRGGAYTGGTLSSGASFGQDGSGDNYAGTKYDPTKGFNLDTKGAVAALDIELKQAIIETLQAAGDIPQAVTKVIDNALAKANVDSVAKLSAEATDATMSALNTVIGSVEAFNTIVTTLPFKELADLSFDTAASLIEFAGGIDNLASNLGGFYTNFYKESEQLALKTEFASKAFAELGVVMPAIDATTRDWYRSLIDVQLGLNQGDEKTAKTTAGLLALQGAVNELAPVAEVIKSAISGTAEAIENQANWQGKLEVALDLTTSREIEKAAALKAADDATDILINSLYALEDAAALESRKKSIVDKYTPLTLEGAKSALPTGFAAAFATMGSEAAKQWVSSYVSKLSTPGDIKQVEDLTNALDTLFAGMEASEARLKSLSDEAANLSIELLTAKGDVAGAASALRELETKGFNAAEIAAYDYNKSLREQITTANNAKAALDSLTSTMRSIRDSKDAIAGVNQDPVSQAGISLGDAVIDFNKAAALITVEVPLITTKTAAFFDAFPAVMTALTAIPSDQLDAWVNAYHTELKGLPFNSPEWANAIYDWAKAGREADKTGTNKTGVDWLDPDALGNVIAIVRGVTKDQIVDPDYVNKTADEIQALDPATLSTELQNLLTKVFGASASVATAVAAETKKIDDITDGLTKEGRGLNVALLEAQGKFAEAKIAARALATEGLDELQIAVWDTNAAVKATTASLVTQNSLREKYSQSMTVESATALLPSALQTSLSTSADPRATVLAYINTLDASTESGQNAINTLGQLTGAIDFLVSASDNAKATLKDIAGQTATAKATKGMTDLQKELYAIDTKTAEWTASLQLAGQLTPAAIATIEDFNTTMTDIATEAAADKIKTINDGLQDKLNVLNKNQTQSEVDRANALETLKTTGDATTISLQHMVWALEDVQAAAATQSSIFDKLATDPQKKARAQTNVDAYFTSTAFTDLGLAVPQTTADFLLLSENANTLTLDGQNLIATLGTIVDDFSLLHSVTKDVNQDYKRALLEATGNTSGLAAFDKAISDAALITAGWTQEMIDSVDTATAMTKGANARKDFKRAMLEASGNTVGLEAFDKAISDAALITAGWTQKMIDAVDATTQATKTATATQDYNRALLDASGNKAGLKAFDRALETSARLLAGWTPQQIAQLNSVVDAAEAVATAMTVVDAALATLGRAIDAQKTSIREAADAQIKALQDSNTAAVKALESQAEANSKASEEANKLVSSLTGMVDSINRAIDTLRNATQGDAMTLLSARAYVDMSLSLARAGTMPDPDKLSEALSTITADTPDNYKTAAEYKIAQAVQAGKLDELGALAGKQLSDAEKQVIALEEANKLSTVQIETLNTNSELQIKTIQDEADRQIKELDKQLKTAQDQVDALKGIDNSVIGVGMAVGGLSIAMAGYAAAVSAQAAAQAAATAAAQQTATAAASTSSQVIDYGAQSGGSSWQTTDASGGGTGGSTSWSFATGTNYVPFDMQANIHEGERIVPEADNKLLMERLSQPGDNKIKIERLERLLEAVVLELSKTREKASETAASIKKLASQFDSVTEGGNAMLTTV